METKEKQYSYLLDMDERKLGLMMNRVWDNDPKRLAFVLARYKFVSKMLAGKKNVLEIGCGDAWPSRLVVQTVEELTVSDFDPLFIDDARSRHEDKWPMSYLVHDMVEGPTEENYDAVYLCDVFEHISPSNEQVFLQNIIESMVENGTLIVGIPSLESQELIAPENRDPGHVNCKSGIDFKKTFDDFFHNVFLFSMNDEMIHTGHSSMAHYLFCICTCPKTG